MCNLKPINIDSKMIFNNIFNFRLASTLNQHPSLPTSLPTSANTLPPSTALQSTVAPPNSQPTNLVMPVFPLRPAPPPASSHYSPYSPSRFHIDKRCQHRCSWKCLSIGLIFLAVGLSAMLAYFAGKKSN